MTDLENGHTGLQMNVQSGSSGVNEKELAQNTSECGAGLLSLHPNFSVDGINSGGSVCGGRPDSPRPRPWHALCKYILYVVVHKNPALHRLRDHFGKPINKTARLKEGTMAFTSFRNRFT